MGQQPGLVADVNVTVGSWVMAAGRTEVTRPQRVVTAGGVVNAWEPAAFGLYEDRDGDIWEKEERGWRLRLQGGVEVEPEAVWGWVDGHVCDYAPFVPWS
ncbi:hypothetical protein GFY24_06460 [Nocardia sp. SYP-A9097]|uniref:hypothetical protein n=1 Tax=Nocardia sp. SYP-A9097 TaxID=2663237 RepID=UPI00129B3C67|nr:hypothetical protein [Nocardia sp. SYP-A9097]MRH87109.1 hypothetical protein [Nocardia sp. SYP-A9097]